MKKKALRRQAKAEVSGAKAILFGAAAGVGLEILFALAAAAVLSRAQAPEEMLGAVTLALPVVSGVAAGAVAALAGGKSGLLRGLFAGALFAAAGILAGAVMPASAAFSPARAAVTFAIVTLCAGLGGTLSLALFRRS